MNPLLPILALIALASLWLRRRPEPAVDRVAVFGAFVDADASPRFARSLPPEPAKAAATFQRIGSVALMSKMTACDDVTRSPFYSNRDFGDENDAA